MTNYVEEYKKIRPTYERFSERLSDLILTLLSEAQIKIHTIEKRTKDIDSFHQKMLKPEKQYNDPLHQITDLCGIRIIVHYSDDLDRISDLLEKEFIIDRQNSSDRGLLLKPNEFGYRSHHYVVGLSIIRSKLPEWHTLCNLKAEIQVRTVLQHAWATISHALQYKNSAEVPSELLRKLFRVSGILELADEEFSSIKKRSLEISAVVEKSLDAGNLEVTLNRDSLKQYITKSKIPREITELALQSGFEIADDDMKENEDDEFAGLAWVCKLVGIKKIDELDSICRNSVKTIGNYFIKLRQKSDGSWYGSAPWFVQLVVMYEFSEYFNAKLLINKNWGNEIAERVIALMAEVKRKNKKG